VPLFSQQGRQQQQQQNLAAALLQPASSGEASKIDPFRLFFNVLRQAKLEYRLTSSRYQYSSLFLTIP